MALSFEKCVLCHDLIQTRRNATNKYRLEDTLANQLTVMFLFRNLLQISSENCVMFLQHNGDNPSAWVIFCHSCTTLIENAEKVHKRILTLKNDLRSFQQQIEQIIYNKLHANRPLSTIESRLDIWDAVERDVVRRMSNSTKVEVEDRESDSFEDQDYSCDTYFQNDEKFQPQLTERKEPKESARSLSQQKKTESRKSKIECSHKCKLCDKKFSKLIFLKRHSLNVHFMEFHSQDAKETLKKLFMQCTSCTQLFANEILLRGHIRSIHEGKRTPFECPHCKKEYHLYNYVTEHYETAHVKDGGFPCDKCSKRFCDMETLKVHSLSVHEADPKPFKCLKCPRTFAKHSHLVKHDQVVHVVENKTFKCDLCPMAFISLIKLNGHQLVKHYKELGLKPIVCDVCNWHFVDQKMLNFHKKRKHFKEFNFFCPHCPKGYAVKENLEAHVIAFHSTGKTHVCPTCEKAFQTKLRLKIHMRRHTNEKIHMCAMCPKIFSERRLLTRHELTAHVDQEKIPCPYCPTQKLFKAKRYLDIHLKSKHAKDISVTM